MLQDLPGRTAMMPESPLRLRSGQAPAGWKNRFIALVLAAKLPKPKQKKARSLLPQAKNARCGASNHCYSVLPQANASAVATA
jgi:hypothetical protein